MKKAPATAEPQAFDVEAALAFVAKRFRELGNPERALREKAYLKSTLRFHGVTSPQIGQVVRELVATYGNLSRGEVRGLVDAAFAGEWFDVRSAALSVLGRRVKVLDPSDLRWLVDLIRQSTTWAHVDWIAPKMIGAVLSRHPDRLGPTLRRLAKDDNFWVRRAALLAQLEPLRKGAGDFVLFAEIAGPMVTEKEFFIRKAIGWVLREVSKKRPELPFEFLREHRAKVSGLTLREGAKYLPTEMRAALGLVGP